MSAATIVLAGDHGRGDLGDDLRATVTADALRRDGREVVIAGDPGGGGKATPASASSLWRVLNRDTLLLLAGGGLLDDRWSVDPSRHLASISVAARLRGSAVAAAGLGLEPPSSWREAQRARTVAKVARVLGVRDARSLAVAQQLGARHAVLGIDLAWLAAEELDASLPPPAPPSSPDLVVVTVAGASESVARRRIALLAGALRALRSHYPGVAVRLVALQRDRSASVDDHALLSHIARFAHLTDAEIVHPEGVEEAAAAMSGVTVAVGCRLSGLILAYLCGARIVALGGGSGVAATFEDAPGATILGEPGDVEGAGAALIAAVGGGDRGREERRRHARMRCDEARRHLRRVVLQA